MKKLIYFIPLLLLGCSEQTTCQADEPIGCACRNGNIYTPTMYNSLEQATQTCLDSCFDKNGMDRLFCRN